MEPIPALCTGDGLRPEHIELFWGVQFITLVDDWSIFYTEKEGQAARGRNREAACQLRVAQG